MVKQVAVHEAPIALGVLLRQAAVLVQIDGRDLGEVDIALVVPLDQLLVGAHGGAAGGQTQHAVGLHDDLRRDDIGGLAGHVVIILSTDDLHKKIPPDISERVRSVILICIIPRCAMVYHDLNLNFIPKFRFQTKGRGRA